MSKLSTETLQRCIEGVLQGSIEKQRGFLETVELQIGLKNYDPSKDRRFSGTVRLPNLPRPRMKVCVIGDAKHCEEAKALGLESRSLEDLKKLNKNKKLIKKLAKGYHAFVASDTVIKQLPRILGPGLNKAGKFSTTVTHTETLEKQVMNVKCSIKFQLKKVLCLATAVGNVGMDEKVLFVNIQMAINFLVSLSKRELVKCKSTLYQIYYGKTIESILKI
eukprot:TRINITY_DN11720_c0_g1_i1.p1 TRINITY_DN11720_c0_g1~~TRINITY_DN11720_c0_g1_i1.p1  ORF type:complete len:220 (+),score=11.80 TRINITY_DN11720_c0_g1_i1:91-750(+)